MQKLSLMSMSLKTADVGHAAKELDLHKIWTRRVNEEFYRQGDKEKEYGLEVSPLCDRKNNIYKSQIGFIDFVVQPLNKALSDYIQNDKFKEIFINQILSNKKYWKDQQEIDGENGNQQQFFDDTDDVVKNIQKLQNSKAII